MLSRPGDLWENTCRKDPDEWKETSPQAGKFNHLFEFQAGNYYFLGPFDNGQISRDMRSVGCGLSHRGAIDLTKMVTVLFELDAGTTKEPME